MSNSSSTPKFAQIISATVSLCMLDGGGIIAIQVITFLLNYFFIQQHVTTGLQQNSLSLGTEHMLIVMLSLLNLAAIIYRVLGLTRGIRYSWGVCFQQALRRWAGVLLLNFVGAAVLLTGVLPLLQYLSSVLHIRHEVVSALIYFLVPYGILAFIFVVDQGKNPFQAILATLDILGRKSHLLLWLCTSLLYAMPMLLKFNIVIAGPYFGLFNSLWALFCHVVTTIIYSTIINAVIMQQKDKNVKVVVI